MRCYRDTGRPIVKQIPEMSREEVNRELCKRLGIDAELSPHGPYLVKKSLAKLPDFYSDSGKIQLLWAVHEIFGTIVIQEGKRSIALPAKFLLDDDGLLAIMALDFLRKEQG